MSFRWRPAFRHLLGPWLFVLIGCGLYLAAVLALNQGDPLAFAAVGSRYAEGNPNGTEGYDGQFSYYIALDPAGAPDRLDSPAYRYQRILYPILARILAFARPAWLPWVLPLLNLVALAAGTAVVEQLLVGWRVSRWYALVYGLYAGLLMSVRLDLNEPVAYALVVTAVWSCEKRRSAGGAVLFALAMLAKETTALFAASFVGYLVIERQYKRALGFGAVAFAPFLTWQIVLWRWLGQPGLGSGGAMATPFEIIPFMGLWRVGLVSFTGLLLYLAILGPLVIVPTMWGLWSGLRQVLLGVRHPVTLALVLNAAAMMFLPHSTWREFLAMLRLSVGLVTAVLLYAGLCRNRRVLSYSLGWFATLAFLVKEVPTT